MHLPFRCFEEVQFAGLDLPEDFTQAFSERPCPAEKASTPRNFITRGAAVGVSIVRSSVVFAGFASAVFIAVAFELKHV